MRKFFTQNLALKFFALLMAVSLVWIKAQERMTISALSGVHVTLDNRPNNLILPNPNWIPLPVNCSIKGPINIVKIVRQESCVFRIDLSKISLKDDSDPVTVDLTRDMFNTNLDADEENRITVMEESIQPRQASIRILPWNVEKERPAHDRLQDDFNQIVIPLLRVEKRVKVIVDSFGEPPAGAQRYQIKMDPESVLLTGPKEAIDRVESVSTSRLDLRWIKMDRPFSLPLHGIGEGFDLRLVGANIHEVTVVFQEKN